MDTSQKCECGGRFLNNNQQNHIKTKKHQDYLAGKDNTIYCFKDELLHKTYSSISEAVQDLKISYNSINGNILGVSNICKGGYDFRRVNTFSI